MSRALRKLEFNNINFHDSVGKLQFGSENVIAGNTFKKRLMVVAKSQPFVLPNGVVVQEITFSNGQKRLVKFDTRQRRM